MEKEFVPYELALRLKSLCFDEPCFGYYDHQIKELDTISSEVCERLCKHDTHIKAPTFSQAFRWFREEHGLCHMVIQNTDKDWTYEVMTIKGITSYYEILDVLDKYEDAEFACLDKLLEIVENKNL